MRVSVAPVTAGVEFPAECPVTDGVEYTSLAVATHDTPTVALPVPGAVEARRQHLEYSLA